MKIFKLCITSPSSVSLECAPSKISVFLGRFGDLTLDLLRESICDLGAKEDPDRIDDGRFVLHTDLSIGNDDYSVCYIRNADYIGDRRLAVNFEPYSTHLFADDSEKYLCIVKGLQSDHSNIFDTGKLLTDTHLSESDLFISSFDRFLDGLSASDDRPVFIYGLFDRIDESVDVKPYVKRLLQTGRQVFISVAANYPIEKIAAAGVDIFVTEV